MLTPEAILNTIHEHGACNRYLVGFSGGVDSTVLLHVMMGLRSQLGAPLQAVHVHHGLHDEADAWRDFCERFCARDNTPIIVHHVDARPARGESPEAVARRARYRAFADTVGSGDCLLTAHHLDDQAETLLLQLLRGSGPHGLAAMAARRQFGEGWHLRPLLEYSRDELREYAGTFGLQWIDDPTNVSPDFDRNYLRHQVMPRIRRRWSGCPETLARAARHQAEAAELLDALAGLDLSGALGSRPHTLSVAAMTQFSGPRCANLIRFWLRSLGLSLPTSRQLYQLIKDVLEAGRDRNPVVRWTGAEVRRYRDDLFAMSPLPHHDPSRVYPWEVSRPLDVTHINVRICLEDLKVLGVGEEALEGPVTVRFRRGGERCRVRGCTHSLKTLLQEAGVPPWERDRIPLVYVEERLVAVVGYWGCS